MKIRFAFALCSLAAVALVGCASHLSGNRATAKLEPTRTDGIESRDGWRIVFDPETRRPIVVEPDTG